MKITKIEDLNKTTEYLSSLEKTTKNGIFVYKDGYYRNVLINEKLYEYWIIATKMLIWLLPKWLN
jgi:hypothetical protein